MEILSQRVTRVLEDDAHRRRWITRTFILLAIIPAIAAALVFLLGRSDVEQTQSLVQQEARKIEAQVSKKVTASVATELKGVREVQALLPELRAASEAAPMVKQNQRALTEYRARMDSVLDQQDKLARSFEMATKNLDERVNLAESQMAQVERVTRSIDSIKSDLQNTRKELEAKVARIPTGLTDNRRLESAVNTLSRQISGINQRLVALERSRADASSGNVVRAVQSIQQQLSNIGEMIANIDKRLQRLEKLHPVRLQQRDIQSPVIK